MCDFGISGYLVDSVAKTLDAGCKPYMVSLTNKLEAYLIKINLFLTSRHQKGSIHKAVEY